jgi:glycerol-3-phosphate responsive antiterminator
MTERWGIHLPRVLEASDGRTDWNPPTGGDVGLLLRDTSLTALMIHAGRGHAVAVDIDSIDGLSDDREGCEFLVRKLGFRIVLAHRQTTAATIADLGALALLRVFAVDSTGLRRPRDGPPRADGIGSAVSPGLVLPHLSADEIALLPRPILAYGLIDRPADIAACLRCADAIVLSHQALAGARTSGSLAELARLLTT